MMNARIKRLIKAEERARAIMNCGGPVDWMVERWPAGLMLTRTEAWQKAGQALRAYNMPSDENSRSRLLNELQSLRRIQPVVCGPRGARGFKRIKAEVIND